MPICHSNAAILAIEKYSITFMFMHDVCSCSGESIIMLHRFDGRVVLLVVCLTLSMTLFGTLKITHAQPTAVVYVDPLKVENLFSPATFTINLKVANVTNLYGFDFQFSWDPNIIKYVSHVKKVPIDGIPAYPGGLLYKPTINVIDQVDETASMSGSEPGTMYWVAEAAMLPAKSFNGTGIMFNMTFQVVGLGKSALKINACTLSDKSGVPIEHTEKNGEFVNFVPPPPANADIFINPSSVVNTSLTPGTNFSVSVDIRNIQNLYSYSFAVAYNATLLNVAQVTGNPSFPVPSITQGTGNLVVSSALTSPPAISGNFSLATIKFGVLAIGETELDLHAVILSDQQGENITFNPPGDGYFSNLVISEISANVTVRPDALNLKTKGRWISVYIELEEGYDVDDIDVSSLRLNKTLPVDMAAPMAVGDFNGNGIDDLLVGFNRTVMINLIKATHPDCFHMDMAFVVTGQLKTGIKFEDGYPVHVSSLLGDANGDGTVNILDLVLGGLSYNLHDGDAQWNPNVNYAPSYDKIDVLDLVTIVWYYGKTC